MSFPKCHSANAILSSVVLPKVTAPIKLTFTVKTLRKELAYCRLAVLIGLRKLQSVLGNLNSCVRSHFENFKYRGYW